MKFNLILFYFFSLTLWTKELATGNSFRKLIIWNTGYSQYQTLVADNFCLHTDPGGTLKYPIQIIFELCQNKTNLYFFLHNDKFHTSYLTALKQLNTKIIDVRYSKLLMAHQISKNHLIVTFGHLDKDLLDQTFNFSAETSKPQIEDLKESTFSITTILDFLKTEETSKNIRLNERYNFEFYLDVVSENFKLKKQLEIKNKLRTKYTKINEIFVHEPKLSLLLPNHGQPKFLTKERIKYLSKFNMVIAGSQSKKFENHKTTESKFLRAQKPLILKNQWGHLVFEIKI